ncbi:MAG: Flp pilus assembly protein CpaB [Pseudomonadota bacterium]
MRLIFGLVLIAGLGLAAFAVHTAQQRFASYQRALAEVQLQIVPTEEVVVVRRQLRYGDALRKSDVRIIEWPASSLPSGVFRSMDQVFPPDIEGTRTILRVMERNEPLSLAKVTDPGEEAGLAAALTKGMRAFTLQVDVNSGVSGFLRPGDRVDVYWTGGGGEGGMTRLIHSNLPLIAIDQQTDEERNNPTIARNVTVEATPEVVAKLAQAQATGRLSLALVGVRDEGESDGVTATLREVLGAPEDAQQTRRVCTVRTRRGAEVVMIPVPCPPEQDAREEG